MEMSEKTLSNRVEARTDRIVAVSGRELEAGAEEINPGRIMNMAMHAGQILLQNGAEISRVEDTMNRLAKAFGVDYCSFFVLSNGIFTTGAEPADSNWKTFAKVQHIPVKGTQLDRVVDINQLSRDVAAGKYTLAEVEQRLHEIENSPAKPAWQQILASGVGAGCFCVIFGGSLFDALAAFLAGLGLWMFVLGFSGPHLGKILGNIAGGSFVTLLCLILRSLGVGTDMNHVIIGAIIPLVPGVAFTNGIRDIADGDYISGSVRLLDAILVFICIAVGVGVMYMIWKRFAGGIPV